MGKWKLAIWLAAVLAWAAPAVGADQGHAVGRPAGRCRDARPACAVGHRQLHGLPQHLRQPGHPRCRRQDRAADRARVAIRQRHRDRVRIRTDVKFHDGTPLTPEDVVFSVKRITNPAFKSPQLGQFNSIVGGRDRRPGQGAADHQGALSGAARPAGQALDRAEALCRERRRREVQSRADGQRALSAGRLAERRARHARGQRQLLARQAARSSASPSSRCRTPRRASPTCAPARPTSRAA